VNILRILIAFILVLPLYLTIDFGWEYLALILLQILAGFDFKLFRRSE